MVNIRMVQGPVVLVVAGASLALVSGAAALSAGAGGAQGSGQYPVLAHDGPAPGSAAGLVFLASLFLLAVGSAVRDGRRLRRHRAHAQQASPSGLGGAVPRVAARPVPVPRVAARPHATVPTSRAVGPHPAARAHGRRTTTGARLELVRGERRA